MKAILIFVAVLGITSAQREESLSVLETMALLPEAYRELQKFVVSVVSDAKNKSTDAIYEFHNEVYQTKDTFVRSAVNLELSTLYHLNYQDVQVDTACLNLLRSSIDMNLKVSGVGFTNCIVDVDKRLNTEIQQIYNQLQVNESAYVQFALYDAFVGRNIFQNPQDIKEQLNYKLSQLQQTPTELEAQLSALVSGFRLQLDGVRATYRQCLTANNQVYQMAVDLILVQLQQVCKGALVPSTTTTLVPSTTTTPFDVSSSGTASDQPDEFDASTTTVTPTVI